MRPDHNLNGDCVEVAHIEAYLPNLRLDFILASNNLVEHELFEPNVNKLQNIG